MNRNLILLLIVLALVLMAYSALPAPASPSTPAVLAQQAYRAGALEEGALQVYTSLDEQEARLLLEKFRQKNPFLKVDYFRASSADVLQKVLAEAKAGMPPPDVLELDAVDMRQLYLFKLLAAYPSPEADPFPEAARHAGGYYTTGYVNEIVVAYNTGLVRPEEVSSWSNLLNPKWMGKIAVECDDWALIPFSAQVMGDQASTLFWTKLSEQKPKVIRGHVQVAHAVAGGEVALSLTAYAHTVEALKKSGQPIEWVKTDPVYAYLNSVAITAKAPHPNAAHVFVDWLLSAEGQTAVAGVGRIPIRPGIKANPITMTEGVKFYYGDPTLIVDVNQMRTHYTKLFPLQQ